MSSRDNEGIAISVLMHKLYAARLRGSTPSLSALGIPVLPSNDLRLTVPLCFDVIRTDGNIHSETFKALESATRAAITEGCCNAVAFVNGHTASFADSFIILAECNIFIQEKRRVTARLASATAGVMSATGSSEAVPAPSLFTISHVVQEYNKLKKARQRPHVFLYLTDEDPALGLELEHPMYAFPPACHSSLLGGACAYLRRITLSRSAVDLRSSAVAHVHSAAEAASNATAESEIGKRRRDGRPALAGSAGPSTRVATGAFRRKFLILVIDYLGGSLFLYCRWRWGKFSGLCLPLRHLTASRSYHMNTMHSA